MPLAAGAALVAAQARPQLLRTSSRLLDAALIAWFALAAAALIPLPPGLRLALAPHLAVLDAALYISSPLLSQIPATLPLSVDAGSTGWALAIGVSAVLTFWSARSIVHRRGLRATSRGIAWVGLALAALTLLQHATSPRLIYWYVQPLARKAMPFGPFVNRNSLATWLVMAIPFVIGYAIARFESRHLEFEGPLHLEKSLDATSIWLAASVLLMLATMFVTASRSGLIGTVVGVASLLWMARRRLGRSRALWLTAIVFAILALATTYASWEALAGRVDETLAVGIGGRREVWRQTWRVISDFRTTGVGVGAYERAMTVYQQTPHNFYINHAHNEYLQMLAEGGLLLAIPALLAAGAFVWRTARLLRAEHSPAFWIRAGAASAVLAALVQSVWDTGLRTPANTILFAIVAAVAVHDPRSRSHR